MRAILLYYMYYSISQGGLGIDHATAASIMAIYGSLVYMSGIIGAGFPIVYWDQVELFLGWGFNYDWPPYFITTW